MNRPPSSPFQPPLGDDLTPQELLDYLNSIFVEVLTPGTVIKGDGRPELATLLRDLCCIMMGEFPQAGAADWGMLKDRVKIIEVSLDLINRTLSCVEGIVGGQDELERIMLAQFLILGATLDTWIASGSFEGEEGTTPQQLKRRLQAVAMETFAVLAGTRYDSRPERWPRPCWEALRVCLDECLGVVAGVLVLFSTNHLSDIYSTDLSTTQFVGPLTLTFFGTPRLSAAPPEVGVTFIQPTVTSIISLIQNTAGTMRVVRIQSVTFFDALIADSLHFVTHALRPLTIQVTVSQIPKHATDVACSYLSYLLDITNNLVLARRTVALARLLRAIEPLLSIQTLETLIIPPQLCRLLVKRLRDGPQPAWDEVDDHLDKALNAIPHGTRLGVETTWLLQMLESRSWEEETESKLRVSSYCSCHCYCCCCCYALFFELLLTDNDVPDRT
jgi:serine/threonine-protein kinase ATR